MSREKSRLAIIIPCFNEEAVIQSTVETLLSVMDGIIIKGKISDNSYIYLIDDGSKDKSWSIIEHLREIYGEKIKGTKFIKNYGNQKALIAGLLGVKEIGCDCVISIDRDLYSITGGAGGHGHHHDDMMDHPQHDDIDCDCECHDQEQ